MQIDLKTGLLAQVDYHPSPNQDNRPDPDDISGIVIHSISLPPGEYGTPWIDDLFLNKLDPFGHPYFLQIADLRVSAHVLIARDGSITQYVPFHCRAWHAGVSFWKGREKCNDFTIGIELEGCDTQPFEREQYLQLSRVILALCAGYPRLNVKNITSHSHISPGRKTDPGPFFDWLSLNQLLMHASLQPL